MIFTNLIQTNLNTKKFGRYIEYYNRLASTNIEAWNLINDNVINGSVVITDSQYEGKGQNNKKWFNGRAKGLAMSIMINEKIEVELSGILSLVAGLSVQKCISNHNINSTLKWPNDIMIEEKKICGILSESKISKKHISKIVIGIGLNINEELSDFPNEIKDIATSFKIVSNNIFQRELIIANILNNFEKYYTIFQDDPSKIIKEWSLNCIFINKEINFLNNNKLKTGLFTGINKYGHAQIKINNVIENFNSLIHVD